MPKVIEHTTWFQERNTAPEGVDEPRLQYRGACDVCHWRGPWRKVRAETVQDIAAHISR